MRDNKCLIVSIVRKGWGDTVLDATIKAGAQGGTVVFGRGLGRNEQHRLFGIQIEPEKEIILTIVPFELRDKMLEVIVKIADLGAPGHGLAFAVPIEALAGATHLTGQA
jgi:nitrogen regulatory protein P-II 1